ncbi:ABC transporter ATP-binding protein [Georgenia sp. AZ-5]|uniref:ABC transporter ATP-binding protein n=1 Tax=Georgenia sp. AZ-5 TaxID=3367526 RepID=UPI003754450B
MTTPAGDVLLEVQDLKLTYGSLNAVDGVSLTVRAGERHALIGPNGAGKSSLFATVAGRTRATSGRVVFGGRDVSALGEAARARAGLVRTFQHSSLFLGMSVQDNVRLAVERAGGRPRRPWPSPRRDRAVAEEATGHLRAVDLLDRREALTGALSHGERRQLEVAMVLACRPRMVMFDEPTAGMSVAETYRFVELVESLPRDITVFVVEHDLDVVFRLAERVSVMAAGRLIAHGAPAEVRAEEKVREAYLGRPRSTAPLFGAAR